MARRSRLRRPVRGDSDDDEPNVVEDAVGGEVLTSEEAVAVASGDETGDGSAESEAAAEAPATPAPSDAKRKRAPVSTPTTAQEEAELARRRRRRQSLVFQKRRQSLTPSKNLAADPERQQSRQYISDMYSTIIKMSSENKINIKNTWSLHLIDHMEDILSTTVAEERLSEGPQDSNTFNFQKASCTLDASVKIYSYRVDDTWTSSYKILENLSRSGTEKRAAHGDDDEDEEGDAEGGNGDEEENPQRRMKKKNSRKAGSAAKTIEKNLNNITLKSLELDFEPDPLFHKMSQTFDEGGAKGMLLANLGVYDGSKILLNSSDVRLATRKLIKDEEIVSDEDSNGTPSEEPAMIDMSVLGKLPCFTKDVMSMEICPPLKRLYDQIDGMTNATTRPTRVVLSKSRLNLTPPTPTTSEPGNGPIEPSTPSKASPSSLFPYVDEDTTPGDDTIGVSASDPDNKASDEVAISNVDDEDIDDDNNEPDEQSFDYGGGADEDIEMNEVDASATEPEATDSNRSQLETSVLIEEAEVDMDAEVTEQPIDPITKPSIESKTPTIKSAADYFRSQAEEDGVKNEEDVAYSQLIETALMRSVVLQADNAAEQDEYSYFDAKLLKNWAGPSHLILKGARKISPALLAFDEETEVPTGSKRGRRPQQKRPPSATDKRSNIIDFLSDEKPDLSKLLKAPRQASSIALSKLVVRKQEQKSAELVFPVDAHIEPKIFFRHFMKPRLQLFHRRLGPHVGMPQQNSDPLISMNDQGLADTDNLAYEDGGGDYGGHDYDGDTFVDDDDDDDVDGDGVNSFFSSAKLISAERVVEKVNVHYERVAKRVDVKKLKTSIWTHLEGETGLLGKRNRRQRDSTEAEQPDPEAGEGEHEEESEIAEVSKEPTTFDRVVEGVAGKVPSNVTVSFYFICMLHLANEKGLRLTGREDLSNFEIKKEEPLGST